MVQWHRGGWGPKHRIGFPRLMSRWASAYGPMGRWAIGPGIWPMGHRPMGPSTQYTEIWGIHKRGRSAEGGAPPFCGGGPRSPPYVFPYMFSLIWFFHIFPRTWGKNFAFLPLANGSTKCLQRSELSETWSRTLRSPSIAIYSDPEPWDPQASLCIAIVHVRGRRQYNYMFFPS